MKEIIVKSGNKTTYKLVPDDWEETSPELLQSDLTTSGRKSIGFSDIDKKKWESIFKK